jgi:PhnB protein
MVDPQRPGSQRGELRRCAGESRLYTRLMTAPQVYVSFPGTAREALNFYASVFGGELTLHTYQDFGRSDGPETAIAHGVLEGAVSLSGSDAAEGEKSMRLEGIRLSLLGAAEPALLHEWFDRLAAGGTILDPLGPKPWGASDGQVVDRHGLHWLIGCES